MEVHIEPLVVHPHRVPERRNPFDPLSVAGNRIQSGFGVFGQPLDIEASMLERQGLCIEDERRAHVHGRGLAFDIEEGRVEGAQPLVEGVRHSSVGGCKICA